MKLIVGLGNPGEKYKNNRHNAGFIVIDELARRWDLTWDYNKKFNAEVACLPTVACHRESAEGERGDLGLLRRFAPRNDDKIIALVPPNDEIRLIKPQTFMNDSGEAVSKALNFFNINPTDLLVVHDDVDLDALQFKLSHNSSSAGHHGVQNIIDKLGTQDFTRLRVGIGRPKGHRESADHRHRERSVAIPLEIASSRQGGTRNDDKIIAHISPNDESVYEVEKYVLQDFPSDQLEAVKKQGIEHLLSSLNL